MSEQLKLTSGKKYKPVEVSKITGWSDSRIRQVCNNFNIEVEKTANNGHRRFTKEQVELLLGIRDKYKDGWSEDNIEDWVKGKEDTTFYSRQTNTASETEVEQLKEAMKLMSEKMKEQENRITEQEKTLLKIGEMFPNGMEAFLQERVAEQVAIQLEREKDQIVTSTIRKIQENKKQQALEEYEEQKAQEPESIFSKLRNKFFSK